MTALVLLPEEGERLGVGPAQAVLKAVSDTTGGTFSMSETTIPPGSRVRCLTYTAPSTTRSTSSRAR